MRKNKNGRMPLPGGCAQFVEWQIVELMQNKQKYGKRNNCTQLS